MIIPAMQSISGTTGVDLNNNSNYTSYILHPSSNTNSDQPSSGLSTLCVRNSEKTMRSIESQFNFNLALTAVAHDQTFQSMVKGYVFTYDSVNDDWSINKKDCSLKWNSVNVIYSLSDSHKTVKNIEFSVNPQTSKIINVTEYLPYTYNIGNSSSPNWGGYEFAGSKQMSGSSPKIYQANATYVQPSVTTPSSSKWGSNACNNGAGYPICALSVWVGLESGQGGGAELAQSGTTGEIACNGCTAKYHAWYELLNSTSQLEQRCTGPVNAGDTIEVTVENDAINTGGNSSKYDVVSADNNTGTLCSVYGTTFSITPVGAPYITERPYNPALCSNNTKSYCTLGIPTTGSTSTVTFNGMITYSNGTSQSISVPWNDGYYYKDLMEN